jgi:hypothetical protein
MLVYWLIVALLGSAPFTPTMDKLKLTGRTLGRVFNYRRVCMHATEQYGNRAPLTDPRNVMALRKETGGRT